MQRLPDSFRLAIAAPTAQKLRTEHRYQVTSPQEALQVFADCQIATSALAATLQVPAPQ